VLEHSHFLTLQLGSTTEDLCQQVSHSLEVIVKFLGERLWYQIVWMTAWEACKVLDWFIV
jgi:hypothetical protein